ncbi:MAG: hypothetical protein RXN79_02390 [Candidatus Nanopusillus sp.]
MEARGEWQVSRLREAFGPIPEISADQSYELLSSGVLTSASTATGSDQWRAMGPSGQSVSGEIASIEVLASAQWVVLSPTLEPSKPFPRASLSYEASTADPMSEAYRIMNEVSGRRVVDVKVEPTEPPLDRFGPIVTVTVDANAREALEMWVRAAREVRGKGFILDVAWTGKTDVSTEEFIEFSARAQVRMGIPPVILDDDQ